MELSASAVTIKASTTMIHEKANEVEAYVKELEQSISKIREYVTKTEEFWIGNASEMYVDMYKRQIRESEEMIVRLKNHIVNLRTIAELYMQAETKIASDMNALVGTVIE
ncbi:MAG: WXG100 family type VII secretion target [Lachnospiraceae bacterium]|nr:WXG100 family type VII secretion target [Lachnospiraceae bacterium]